MSWAKASEEASRRAEKYERTACLVTTERREAFRLALLELDQSLLVEWLHHRLAQEFRDFARLALVKARAEVTLPDIPRLKPPR